ncbi:MAG TPA: phosphonate ABC transporter, permease protein PhnE, partial [Noviherbaspirillum sp.]|nr:phosphonate ABC transporter, permease protein PhnE [Noviherbaspirillum sp.]
MNAAARTSEAFRFGFWPRVLVFVLLAYIIYASSQLGFSWTRFVSGLDNGARFLSRMFPPDMTKMDILWKGISESLQIAVLASVGGILLSLPIGLMGARNLMPGWLSWSARALVAVCRSLHPVIVAILFVKAVGFGALAGILALIVASIGFIG